MAELKDSGARRHFETGAMRDISEGKGRCDLLALDVVGLLRYDEIFTLVEQFKQTKDVSLLLKVLNKFIENHYLDFSTAMLELSIHFEDGARKYSENNWKKGIPLHCFIDSGIRHYLKVLRGDTDEPHERAFMWNIMCAIWTCLHKPDMDDIERDISVDK